MPPTTLFGLGYGTGPAGYGYPPGARRPSISYPDSPFTWYDHVEITASLPTNGGGPITNYSVLSGSLPAGVSLNATTGELTGTPTTQQSAASVVIRARGPGGVSDTTISVEVLAMPLSLGSSLAAWYRADAGCYTDAACLFASASSQYLSRAGSAPLRGGTTWWRAGFAYLTNTGTARVLQSCLSGNDGYQVEITAANVLKLTAGTGSATATATHGTALSATTWYFWYAYFDGTNIGISLNGGAAVTQALGAAYSAGTASFFVGSDPTPANYMNGALARNYGGDGTLAAGSITALYAAGAGLFYADLGATLTAAVASGFAFNLCESSDDRIDSVGALNLTPTNGPTVAAGPGEGAAVNNSPVKRWESRYGTDHAVQATIAKQPLWLSGVQNGLPVVDFDGTNDEMTFTGFSADQVTLAAVANLTPFSDYQMMVAIQKEALYSRLNTAATWGMYNNAEVSSGVSMDATYRAMIASVRAANDVDFYDNGTRSTVTSGSSYTTRAGGVIGSDTAQQFHDGGIGEIVIASDDVTAGVGAQMATYFRSRWATP